MTRRVTKRKIRREIRREIRRMRRKIRIREYRLKGKVYKNRIIMGRRVMKKKERKKKIKISNKWRIKELPTNSKMTGRKIINKNKMLIIKWKKKGANRRDIMPNKTKEIK